MTINRSVNVIINMSILLYVLSAYIYLQL